MLRGQNALNIRPGDMVLVMGAGPIGMMHAKLARLSGAGRVIVSEPNPARREQVRDGRGPRDRSLHRTWQGPCAT